MAETTKLASTFTAWRLRFSVELSDLPEACKRCRDLGLDPDVGGWDDKTRVYVRVAFPVGPTVDGEPDINAAAFWRAMKGTTVRHDHWARVQLICPVPKPEIPPCRIGDMYGRCGVCCGVHPLIGPISNAREGQAFLMASHPRERDHQICLGVGSVPRTWPVDKDGRNLPMGSANLGKS